MSKNILEQAKWLTNGAKLSAIIIALTYNIVFTIIKGKIPSIEEQKSLLYLCAFIVGVFGTIDLSLIVKNIFKGDQR